MLGSAGAGPYTGATGSTIDLPAGQFAQYRIEFTSDGVLEPSVDWVELFYSGY